MDELAHTSSSFSRRAPTAKCKAAALLALVLLFAAPAHGEDLISQWLQQDGTGSQTEEPRQDLNALTDAQWKTLFRFGAVAGVVGIESGVVSGVFNLESSGVRASDWRPRHDKRYHKA